jgi:biopolymer transport protein ExbD
MPAPKRPAARVFGEINVTPLIDVCLVLLIVFMVVTPLLDQVPLALPETEDPGPVTREDENKVSVSLASGKSPGVFLGDDPKPISLADLEVRLAGVYAASPSTRILLRADRGAHYGEVRSVMAAVHRAGFQSLGLVTRKEKDGGPLPGALFATKP